MVKLQRKNIDEISHASAIVRKSRDKARAKINYQIILLVNGKEKKILGKFEKKTQCIETFNKMIELNKNVVFPKRYLNSTKIEDVKYEIAIIKKIKNEDESKVTKLRNDIGIFVEYEIENSDKWVLYDKARYEFEETFFVNGYDPFYDRKDFNFIFNELFAPKAESKENMIEVVVFKNKLIFSSYNNMDIVLCKNIYDSVRLYNEIEKLAKGKRKYRFAVFNGNVTNSTNRKMWIEKIIKFTQWSKLKIMRNCLKP